MKKLLADAQRIGAEQEARAKKAAEKKTAERLAEKSKAVEEKVVSPKAAVEPVGKLEAAKRKAARLKAADKRPQPPNVSESEPVKKKQKFEAARSYIKSLGSAIPGIPIRAEPLSTIISEDFPRNAEKTTMSPPSTSEGIPILHNKDVTDAQAAGQDETLPPVVGDEAVQTTPPETNLDLPELLTTRVDVGVGT